MYFTAWSISFWPQIIENHRTRDVSGLSADYLVFSLVGFVCYSAYTGALYFSDDVRSSYAALHGGAAPDVSAADFAFAAHAVLATLLVSWQYVTMRRPEDSGLSPLAAAACGAAALACCGAVAQIGATCDVYDCASWMPLLLLLGSIKVCCTMVKYTPQVLHNHQRRSTGGWSLTNVLLDLAGGSLSFGQVLFDAAARHDVSVIAGNPAKLWIAALSIGYDVIFVLQHYVLYKDDSPTSTSPPGAGVGAGEAGRAGGAQAQVVATVPVAAERGREQPRRRSGVRAFAERVRTTVKGAKPQP